MTREQIDKILLLIIPAICFCILTGSIMVLMVYYLAKLGEPQSVWLVCDILKLC